MSLGFAKNDCDESNYLAQSRVIQDKPKVVQQPEDGRDYGKFLPVVSGNCPLTHALQGIPPLPLHIGHFSG